MLVKIIEKYSLTTGVVAFILFNMVLANIITFGLMQLDDDPKFMLAQSIATIASSVSAFILMIPSIILYRRLEKAEEDARYNYNIDSLTNLLSRKPFTERLSMMMSDDSLENFGLFFIDLDHFKRINDRFGHLAGDKVMAAVGEQLRANTPIGGTVARYGGEEFVMALTDTDPEAFTALAEKIRLALNNDILYEAQKIEFTASIGGVYCKSPHHSCDQLLKLADQQMYKAKAKGRNCIELLLYPQ